LAVAGLRRLGLQGDVAEILPVADMCPAPGQGALAVQTRAGDPAFDICRELTHEPTAQAVHCERAVLAGLGGGCQLPIAAFAEVVDRKLRLTAGVFAPNGSRHSRVNAEGPCEDAEQLGHSVAADLLAKGAGEMILALKT
ncbi:MAG: hydroxymethylbilane synthase, partial [Acidobacteriaceae bacterium]|nr:hydroxymethylbilane synthase [Acidobacteriaceae bacterium]